MNGSNTGGNADIAVQLSVLTMTGFLQTKKRKKRGQKDTILVCTLSASTKTKISAEVLKSGTPLRNGGQATRGGPVNYNRSRYWTQSTLSRLIDSQEAHGRTQDELEVAKKRISELEGILNTLLKKISETNAKSLMEEENE
jgi:hypothetical protein